MDEDGDKVEIKSENSSNEEVIKLNKRVAKLEKEIVSLNRYNEDLRSQLELMNAKFHLSKQFLYKNVHCQTDDLLQDGGDEKFVVKNEVELNEDGEDCDYKQMKHIKSDLDDFLSTIKSEANDSLNNGDYCYDEKSNTYYSRSTGWYFYPESSAFYNPQNRSFYSYDHETKEYKFMFANDEQGNKIDNSEDVDSDEFDEKSEEEDGEIFDSDSPNDDVDDSKSGQQSKSKSRHNSSSASGKKAICMTNSKSSPWSKQLSIADYTFHEEDKPNAHRLRRIHSSKAFNKISPIRFIVMKSDELDLGSLMLVDCMGGKVGQHDSCCVIIPDEAVSKLHAQIQYHRDYRTYFIEDLCSKNGTFINDVRLKPLEQKPIKHGDIIKFSIDCQLLAHIHSTKNVTCDECEPGTAMAKYAEQQKQQQLAEKLAANCSEENQKASANNRMNRLKKKYGLSKHLTGDEEIQLGQGYQDRAAKRKRDVGSDNPYEKTEAGSAVDMPLTAKNKGFKMMEKMGWKSGTALGHSTADTARTEPIEFDVKENRTGLGFGGRQ